MNTCYICEYGWIVIGEETNRGSEQVTLQDASVVRNWSNGKGIGGIAKEANRDEYTLDPIGKVKIRQSKILFEIPCEL